MMYADRQPVRSLPQYPYTHAQVAEARKRVAAKRYLFKRIGPSIYCSGLDTQTDTQTLVRLCQGMRDSSYTA